MKLKISYNRLTSQNYHLIKFNLDELEFIIDFKYYNRLLIFRR